MTPNSRIRSLFTVLVDTDVPVELNGAGWSIMDDQLRFLAISPELADINGVSIDEHIGRSIQSVIPDAYPTLAPIFERIRETREPMVDQVTTLSIGGARRSFFATYAPILTPGREVIGYCCLVRTPETVQAGVDILTRSSRAMARLQEVSQHLQAITAERRAAHVGG